MSAKFNLGEKVRVRIGTPPTHFRTPAYIQGKTGVVVSLHGAFRNPESLAYGGDGLPKQPLYLVRFAQSEVWGQDNAAPADTLYIDIYEPWLEATEN